MPGFHYYNTMGDDNGITNYLTISDGDEWPSGGALKSIVVIKGNDHFIVVESPDSQINWMEPKY
jgi:hypothetical protein